VQTIADPVGGERLGLARGAVTVLVHSGSRGLGDSLGRRWGDRVVVGDDLALYLGELAGACRFARANRLLLTFRLLGALGVTRPDDIGASFDIVHNDVRQEVIGGREVWVHRKGAAPAHDGAPTVVLGSRGAPSWIVLGRGSERALRSVAHGAGRRMSRTEARAKLGLRYRKHELTRSALGTRILCDDTALLYEEHADAYKPIEPVVAALEEAGAATRVASLVPIMTVKR
jgi:release factor H-coupled RctB family protein